MGGLYSGGQVYWESPEKEDSKVCKYTHMHRAHRHMETEEAPRSAVRKVETRTAACSSRQAQRPQNRESRGMSYSPTSARLQTQQEPMLWFELKG